MILRNYFVDNQWYALRDLVQRKHDSEPWDYDNGDHVETFVDYMMDNFGVVYVEEPTPRQGKMYWGCICFTEDIDYTLFVLKYSGTAFDWLVNKDYECLST